MPRAPVVSPWTCSECGEHFISEMARDQHARRKHGRRSTLSRKIGDTSTCPNCMTDFRQRFRLVHHAREKREKERGCRDFWRAQPDVDSDSGRLFVGAGPHPTASGEEGGQVTCNCMRARQET